jgi:hypothetical protein
MWANGETAATICETLGIGRTTFIPLLGRRRDGAIGRNPGVSRAALYRYSADEAA